ncbi:hypothetical protein [Frigidibacter oleivorans]|uniref:hypothetical protein n=1 Tax=Frigidibacter oleivorans TaxID=2487129 RepID=UPI000F8C6009|nr:hypothetical protein [Frigidibacter oleivorans]
MPLVLIGFVLFFVLAWWWHRSRSLTRDCLWREDRRRAGPGESWFHCLACGAELTLPRGQEPRDCLRGRTGRGAD